MTINEHVDTFAGLPVRAYEPGQGLDNPAASAWLVGLGENCYEPEAPLADVLSKFFNEKGVFQVNALVIGTWEDMGGGTASDDIVKALVDARVKLPELRALFFGDVTVEECEISWMVNCDMAPLVHAFPKLDTFRVRGGSSLAFKNLKHPALKSLIVETGGLSGDVLRQIASADLPSLERLELWLGDSSYGADWTFDALQPILAGAKFPKLKSLGLRDSEKADEVAAAVAKSPLLQKLHTLDLSMGTLGDEGGKALLAAPLQNLRKLDLSHHYLSDALVKRFRELAVDVVLEDPQGPDEERYVVVGE